MPILKYQFVYELWFMFHFMPLIVLEDISECKWLRCIFQWCCGVFCSAKNREFLRCVMLISVWKLLAFFKSLVRFLEVFRRVLRLAFAAHHIIYKCTLMVHNVSLPLRLLTIILLINWYQKYFMVDTIMCSLTWKNLVRFILKFIYLHILTYERIIFN